MSARRPRSNEAWLRQARSGRWPFLFAEIALYDLVVLAATGIYLAVFFNPSMTRVIYHGSYGPLRGVPVSQAYDSALHISLDMPGGLLIRQIHQWAAVIFVAAVCLQLLQLFFTREFRRPRRLHWLIWVALLPLGMVEGWTGSILPDDMLSGGSLSLLQAVLQSIPVVGTHLMLWMFGGAVPGHQIIPRFYWLHLLVLPVVMIGLLVLGRRLARRTGLTRQPGSGRHGSGRHGSGRHGSGWQGLAWHGPGWRRLVQNPAAATSLAMFFATCGVLTLLGTFAQIDPIWSIGPYQPGATTSGAVPDWYMGFLDGGLRIMPGWEVMIAGHPLTLAVLVPALIVPGVFFALLAAYPVLESWLTGDRGMHLQPDRPRDAVTRTAVGVAGMTFYGVLWAAAANDQIAYHFHLDLFTVTWVFRVAVFVGPVLAFALTRWICLALSSREREEAEHGHETGRIVMSPDGGFSEIIEPVPRPRQLADPRVAASRPDR
jgi:ubiquinol-cytochrome c reductase cytochrome b subunit